METQFKFQYPELLWILLIVVPLLVLFFWWAWRTRQRLISQFVQSRLLATLTVGVSTRRQKWRMALLVIASALLLLTLARPQWGFTWEEAKQRGLDVVVGIDTSRSMLAPDVRPNRLGRAKLAALDLKRLARTDRVGLVAFAGSAFLQCPLSFDDEVFRQSLDALDVNVIPQGGTALAEAIQTAQAAFKEKSDNHKILVLFSDGEDHDGNAVEAAKEAAKDGLRIFTIGVGTGAGELIRAADSSGKTDYIRDSEGNVVKSHLNEPLLKEIAQAGNGFYMLLSGANTINMLYERGLAPLPKMELSARRVRRYHERFQWLLGLTLVALVAEMFLPERKRVQRTEAILKANNPELQKVVTVLIALMVPSLVWGSPAGALKNYKSGRFDAALTEYDRLLKDKPDDARLHFNAGTAAYRAKEYAEAQKHLNAAVFTDDLQLQQQAYYNLGNAQFRLGEQIEDLGKRQEAWNQAVNSFDSALKLNPKDTDAQFNLDLVKKKIEELKQQQKQQQQQQQQNKDQKNNNDSSKQDDQKKDDQKNQDQKQQEKQQQEQQKQEQQKQQQNQNQPKPDEQKQDQSNQAQPDKKDGEKPEQEKSPGQMQKMGQMTPEQAQRLLDNVKNEEKAMIFVPQNRTNRQDRRITKDW
jgi:Ca-activated chloride channel family protein